MDCGELRERLSDLLDGTLSPPEQAELERHLVACAPCAAEEKALRETVSLLRALPVLPAPPGLRDGIRGRIEAEQSAAEPAGRPDKVRTRARIPLSAAAAVLLVLLAYGTHRELTSDRRAPATAERRESAQALSSRSPENSVPASREEAAPGRLAKAPATASSPSSPAAGGVRGPAGQRPAGRLPDEGTGPTPSGAEKNAASSRAERFPGTGHRPIPAAEPAARERPGTDLPAPRNAAPLQVADPSLPAVTASRASLSGSSPVPSPPAGGPPEEISHPPMLVSVPPSRLLRTVPHAREVLLVIPEDRREGLEHRIIAAAEALGGAFQPEPHGIGVPVSPDLLPDAVRVQVPQENADRFLATLEELGTVPPGGIVAKVDLPLGVYTGLVGYTVRIRAR